MQNKRMNTLIHALKIIYNHIYIIAILVQHTRTNARTTHTHTHTHTHIYIYTHTHRRARFVAKNIKTLHLKLNQQWE